MKKPTHPLGLSFVGRLGVLLAGCGNRSDSAKAYQSSGRRFGVSLPTMINPFYFYETYI